MKQRRAVEADASVTSHIGKTQEVNSAELILKYCILKILICKVSCKKTINISKQSEEKYLFTLSSGKTNVRFNLKKK